MFIGIFETALTVEQIKKKTKELSDICAVKWNRQNNRFVIRKKIDRITSIRFRSKVYVEGLLESKHEKVVIILTQTSAMRIMDLLLFFILDFLVVFSAGISSGIDQMAIWVTSLLTTIFVYIVTNFIAIFTQAGKDICDDTVEILKRNLILKETIEEK